MRYLKLELVHFSINMILFVEKNPAEIVLGQSKYDFFLFEFKKCIMKWPVLFIEDEFGKCDSVLWQLTWMVCLSQFVKLNKSKGITSLFERNSDKTFHYDTLQ